MEEEVKELARLLQQSKNIVFFGGAGVSTESGIPDFRSAKGLWNEKLKINFTPEQLVSHTFFMKYPEEFFAFYREKLLYPAAKPNACHQALARLEKQGRLKAVVTQNIDGLHQAAGSQQVFELHEAGLKPTDETVLTKIFSILKSISNVNYTYYKQTTILRRIERRMKNINHYLEVLALCVVLLVTLERNRQRRFL